MPETPSEQLALAILQRLQRAGFIAYLAGGCVRDRLMGRPPNDFDVATSATPDEVLRLFPRSQKVGVAFGVVLVRERGPKGEAPLQVEVATFRSDGAYSDGRHPDQVQFTTPERDAQRRDFTCNGLFLDPLARGGQGELHDFVGGRRDIQARLLRAIGAPDERFREDHLRMMRAVRFAAKLGFSMETQTQRAITRLAPNIRTISTERVHDELAMILEHPSRAPAAELLESTGLLREIWPPELSRPDEKSSFDALRALPPAGIDFSIALAALCRDLARDGEPQAAADLLRQRLLLSNAETADLAWLLEQSARLAQWNSLSKAALKRVLADPRWPRLAILMLHVALPQAERQPFQNRVAELESEGVAPAPFINGGTLIRLGATPGPAFKAWLEEFYDRQLNGEFATQDQALAAARERVASGK